MISMLSGKSNILKNGVWPLRISLQLDKSNISRRCFSSLCTQNYVKKEKLKQKRTAVIPGSCQIKYDCLVYPQIYQRASFFKKAEKGIPQHDPEKGKLIYHGTISTLVQAVKAFSISTSIIGICFQPFLYQSLQDMTLSVPLQMFVGGFLGIFILFTPLLLHYVTKRYVINMYYNSKTQMYYANTFTIFVNKKEHKFTADEVSFSMGIFSTFKVNNTPFFADPSMFLDKEAYIKLMGYDKPIDWSYPSDKDQTKKKEMK